MGNINNTIKCPECGNIISASDSQCLNCGFKYKVCPECGEVNIENSVKCRNCGALLNKCEEASDNCENISLSVEFSDAEISLEDLWGKAVQSKSDNVKYIGYAIKAVYFINMVIEAVFVSVFFEWFNTSNPLTLIVKAETCFNTIKILTWIQIVLLIIKAALSSAKKNYIDKNMVVWIKKRNLNPVTYLKKYLDFDNEDPMTKFWEKDKVEKDMQLCYLSIRPQEQRYKKLSNVACLIAESYMYIVGNLTILGVFQALMVQKINGTGFEYNWIPLIVNICIAAAIFLFAYISGERVLNKHAENWIKDEFLKNNILNESDIQKEGR